MRSDQRDNDSELSEKCRRLEQLLHQALALASEIAEDKGQQRARSSGHPPGECIILRRASVSDFDGERPRTASHAFPRMGGLDGLKGESQDNQRWSDAPSVQEPFSPGMLALSLDAVVEEDKSDNGSCLLDSGSTMSIASRLSETPNKTTGLVPIDEVGDHIATGQLPSPPLATAAESPRQGQERDPPPSKTTSTQTPVSSQLAGLPRDLVRSASTQSCPLPASHEQSHPVTDAPEVAVNMSPSAEKCRGDSYTTADGGEAHLPPSKWHVRITPIPWSSSPGISPPTFVKLEAVFPYGYLADNNDNNAASSPAWGSSKESYIAIGRPPSHFLDHGRGLQAVREKSLQDHIDEWDDYATEMLDADDAR